MITRIFLDLDGVLADWASAAIVACGQDPAEVYRNWPRGEYDLAVALGVSGNAMWKAVHQGGSAFWANLRPYPWMEEPVGYCEATAPTTILTSPSREPDSLAGKLKWLQHYFGTGFARYLIGPDKVSCARPGAVLIDDREHGCDEFARAGGHAIVFPQTWNRHGRLADPVGYVSAELERIR